MADRDSLHRAMTPSALDVGLDMQASRGPRRIQLQYTIFEVDDLVVGDALWRGDNEGAIRRAMNVKGRYMGGSSEGSRFITAVHLTV